MLSFLKKALTNRTSPEAMAAAAKFVQDQIRSDKVYIIHLIKMHMLI